MKINENLESISKNEQILYENLNNNILEENTVFERNIYGDGNCFFLSVSFFFTNSQNYHEYYRNYIYNYGSGLWYPEDVTMGVEVRIEFLL